MRAITGSIDQDRPCFVATEARGNIRTIDRVMKDRRFAPLLEQGRVGVYGMSAGGLTALEFSGATWSLSRLVKHCADHFEEDVAFCGFRELAASKGKLDDATKQRLKAQYVQGARREWSTRRNTVIRTAA